MKEKEAGREPDSQATFTGENGVEEAKASCVSPSSTKAEPPTPSPSQPFFSPRLLRVARLGYCPWC